jgi:aryl-alcohol dehydrogenase (NADP+)
MPLEYRPLGRTGVKVSSLCLGAMMFGGKTGAGRTTSSTARSTQASTSSTPRTSTASAAAKK